MDWKNIYEKHKMGVSNVASATKAEIQIRPTLFLDISRWHNFWPNRGLNNINSIHTIPKLYKTTVRLIKPAFVVSQSFGHLWRLEATNWFFYVAPSGVVTICIKKTYMNSFLIILYTYRFWCVLSFLYKTNVNSHFFFLPVIYVYYFNL